MICFIGLRIHSAVPDFAATHRTPWQMQRWTWRMQWRTWRKLSWFLSSSQCRDPDQESVSWTGGCWCNRKTNSSHPTATASSWKRNSTIPLVQNNDCSGLRPWYYVEWRNIYQYIQDKKDRRYSCSVVQIAPLNGARETDFSCVFCGCQRMTLILGKKFILTVLALQLVKSRTTTMDDT